MQIKLRVEVSSELSSIKGIWLRLFLALTVYVCVCKFVVLSRLLTAAQSTSSILTDNNALMRSKKAVKNSFLNYANIATNANRCIRFFFSCVAIARDGASEIRSDFFCLPFDDGGSSSHKIFRKISPVRLRKRTILHRLCNMFQKFKFEY